ncbi:MAG TPA: histidine kinase, partial [Hymenobacter sp.]|nr:histidine kinase [Hymenobacter sp.]
MHLTQNDFVLTIMAVVLSVALLATFFFVVLYRYYRASTRHHRALLKAMAETEEQERQRIAEDMHDGLGQLLSGVKMQIGALERYDNPELYGEVGELKRSLDEGMLELRRIVRNLVPRRVEHDGLVAALSDMCEHLDKNIVSVDIGLEV